MQAITDKALLRKLLLERRFSIKDKQERSNKIYMELLNTPEFLNAENVFMYISKSGEVDTDKLFDYCIKSNKKVFVPKCFGMEMDFYHLKNRTHLKIGMFDVHEPDIDKCLKAKADNYIHAVCIVPGLAFDYKGGRMGYGKGYYDRFLAGRGLYTIGICFDAMLEEKLPVEAHDIPVKMILTETRTCKEGNLYDR